MTFLKRAIADGHARITGGGKNQKISYVAAQHSERFSDPAEPVHAEFWVDLIYRISAQVRSSNDFARQGGAACVLDRGHAFDPSGS